jgi:alpha-L-fucosidase
VRHRVPEWYRDAKLGIMVRWGVPSVPAYAPPEVGTSTGGTPTGPTASILRDHDWPFFFRNNPNADWYLNSLRIPDSPVRAWHRRHFGDAKYERLAKRFNEELPRWDPVSWAELFREAGARYVVMTAKHHDGFLMWPSRTPPVGGSFVAGRDVVGELGEAVRSQGMRYGLSYSGRLDWTVQHDALRDVSDVALAPMPAGYADYVDAHYTELIERYRPDTLRSTCGLPDDVSRRRIFHAYRAAIPEGVLAGRWWRPGQLARRLLSVRPAKQLLARRARSAFLSGDPFGEGGDVVMVECAPVTRLRARPWELSVALGNSFGYNAAEPEESYLTGEDLIRTLADAVSKNGNLLLSVAPRADGTIGPEQRGPLAELAVWLRVHGEAIFDTRPWHRAEGRTADGLDVRYTTKPGRLFAIVLGRPRMMAITFTDIDLRRIPRDRRVNDGGRFVVSIHGCDRPIEASRDGERITVDLPGSFVPSGPIVVEFAWRVPAEPVTDRFYTDII